MRILSSSELHLHTCFNSDIGDATCKRWLVVVTRNGVKVILSCDGIVAFGIPEIHF